MKRFHILLLLIISMGLTSNATLTSDFYKAKSVLAEGKWVKVGIDKTGVFEISYDALRQMGFSNPEKVSVFGRGGRVLPEDFSTNAGTPSLSDDLDPVKVIHENNKLYFYGLGPEEIQFVSDSKYENTGGYFQRKSNNIYSNRGYYFLTDSSNPEIMEVRSNGNTSNIISKGVSYLYHERDSVQNTTNSGQLFWGEYIGAPLLPKRTWNVKMPDGIQGDGVMECTIYAAESWQDASMPPRNISYGFENTEGYFTTPYVNPSSSYYLPHNPTVSKIEVPSKEGIVFAEFTNYEISSFSYLDYWVVTYQRAVPTLKGTDGENLNQQFFALPAITRNGYGKINLKDCATFKVLDVSYPATPTELPITRNGASGTVVARNNGVVPQLVVFDTQMPQYQICGYEESYSPVANQNLHRYKETGADFIIICAPSLKQYAEEIADLHRQYDGIQVAVATSEECYNEFSGGVPDPMAYRSFAKMLYMSPVKPKNMLLLGSIYADFRGINAERNPFEGLIAYQSPDISITRGSYNINDFYGMMDDIIRKDYIERNNVHIGVAIMPVRFQSEAEIVVEKIRNYLERTDHAYYLNRYTAIGGTGDSHTHDTQVKDIDTYVRNLSNLGTIFTPLSIDTYGNAEAQRKFFNQLNEGTTWFTYFGHGAEQFLGKDRFFFSAGDVYKLRNTVLPFAGFAGCQITNTDRGVRGLGETIVTATPYGCIGSLVSARETWSGQNMEFFKQFFTCLYKVGPSTSSERNAKPRTIGEVYASVKNYSTYNNELAYQLLCDPALVIPTINQDIEINTDVSFNPVPGETMTIAGHVTDIKGNKDTDYNGEIVVRLMEPTKYVPCGKIITNEDPGSLEYIYRDAQISMGVATVENGEFSVNIHVPAEASKFSGEKANIFFCAYNPTTKAGAGHGWTIQLEEVPTDGTSESNDVIPPTIEKFAFNDESCSIDLTVSDNVALNYSNSPLSKGLYLYIDGKERSEAHFTVPIVDPQRVAFSKSVLLDGLSYGEHSAALKVKDAAGNVSMQEFVFTYNPNKASYVIKLSESSTADSSVIEAEGISPAESTLVILSTSGMEIWSGSFTNGKAVWNHVDMSGAKVPAGHYKGYIIEKGNSINKGHSETIDIPVI